MCFYHVTDNIQDGFGVLVGCCIHRAAHNVRKGSGLALEQRIVKLELAVLFYSSRNSGSSPTIRETKLTTHDDEIPA